MDEKESSWPGSNSSSGYALPPPFTPGAESWGAPSQSSNPGDVWGGPMYGSPPPVHPAQMQQFQQLQLQQYHLGSFNPPGLWRPGAMYEGPPPMNPQGGMPVQMGRGGPRGGGRGGSMPTYNHFDYNQNPNWGGPKNVRGGGRGRGRGAMSGPPVSVNPEVIQKAKDDGRKSAIAETIALMNKMKMEDKERKELAEKREEQRRAANPQLDDDLDNQDEDEQPHDGPAPPRRHGLAARENVQPRGGGRGAKRPAAKTRGAKVGQQNMAQEQPGAYPITGQMNPGAAQFNMPANIGQHTGDMFSQYQGLQYLAGIIPNDVNSFANHFNHPGMMDQFNPGFQHGRGAPGGQFNPGFHQGNGQHFMQHQDQAFQHRGRGRGGGGPQYFNHESDPPSWDQKDNFDGATRPIQILQHVKPEDNQSKNSNSEQGTPKGQLALLATNDSLPGNSVKTTKSNKNNNHKSFAKKDLRERLIQQLVSGQSDCMICLEKIKPVQATWDCKQCYQIFHIFCIKKWSRSALTDSGGWRCPGCQGVTKATPSYVCFCGKMNEPIYTRGDTPHSCGEVCGREKKITNPECPHRCIVLCHPGPCPPCTASIMRKCSCGRTKKNIKCGAKVSCKEICAKKLYCGRHTCKSVCHEGPCDDCDVIHTQTCFCERKIKRDVVCGDVSPEDVANEGFSCEEECQKILECGNHKCTLPCHPGKCGSCDRGVDMIERCPCDKKSLKEMSITRKSCLDDVPTCLDICGKKLSCGQVAKNHTCQSKCHTGPCPPCPLTTKVLCRCGAMDKEIECAQLSTRADDALCEKKCSKKRNCGKHKCGLKCCIDPNHICTLVCGKALSCGQHRCQEFCHFGNCSVCTNVSFEELRCYCGSMVIYPPIACGKKPPPCSEPCRRSHSCSHEVRHSCHSEATCPPCVALTEKWCHGNHELRKNVLCHLEGIFCGRPCGLELPCGRHKCIKPCHLGKCLDESKQEKCSQACVQVRSGCGHPCNAPCHDGPCPSTPCNEKMKLKCMCGHLSATVMCSKNESDYRRLHTALLASKMSNLQYGSGSTTIEINDLWPSASSSRNGSAKKQTLDCNEECALLERNRRLALALQIENPEMSSKLTAPKFSEFLKDFARKEPAFAQNIHDRLTELVKLAKESKQKSRSYSFDCMNREKRQFIHEYSDHFGVTTESFDCEPKRNVVATALKDKIWLPSQSLNEVVQNLRKALGPVSLSAKNGPISGGLTALWKSGKGAAATQTNYETSRTEIEDKKPSPPIVDYFDD